jgi:acetylornithine deacetylase
VTEPTDLAICRAHRGFIWYEVVTSGRAAHGSRYNEGIDANMRMGRFLAELDRLEKALRARIPHFLLGTPSLHASTLHGGTAFSVYAASCKLQLERRTLPDEEQSEITATLEAIASSLASRDETFQAEISTVFARSPFEISQEADIVSTVQAASSRYLKRVPAHIGQTYWTDAAVLADAGMETVIIGPKGHGLHSKEEWVDVESVVTLAGILAESARLYCGETS